MIALEDLIGFCDLTADEVHAIAEHEHISDALAAVLGTTLLQSEDGPEQIRVMLRDDIRAAVRRRDVVHARHLVSTLCRFLHQHPCTGLRCAA